MPGLRLCPRSRRARAAKRRYAKAPALLAQLVEHLHGKEGVDGSSPSEGFLQKLRRCRSAGQFEDRRFVGPKRDLVRQADLPTHIRAPGTESRRPPRMRQRRRKTQPRIASREI